MVLLGALVLLNAPIKAQPENGGVLVDEIIAKVDNYIVLKSDLEGAYLQYLSSGQGSGPQAKCGILEQLIVNKLLVAKAEIDSVIVSDAEVDGNLDRRMQIIISQYGGSPERLEEYYGKSINRIREEIRDQIKEQLIVQRMQSTITSGVTITPAEVKKFFNRIPTDSLPYFSTEVEVAQIVKIPEVGKDQKSRAKSTLYDLKDRIENGESFNVLAKEYSQGPSGRNGGELGIAKRGAMVPEYEAAALKLKPGELSDPVETEFGFHLIELKDRRGNEYDSRHILIIPEFSENDIQIADDYLDSLKNIIELDSMAFEQAAKEYSDDQLTSGSGGFFLDQSGSTKISVDNLDDPVIFFTIDTMQVGQISPPIKFRMDDGKEAVRIIYFKSRIEPHQASLRDDWQKIQSAALNEKQSRALSTWFNKARNDVFIRIDDNYNNCNIMRQ